MDRTLTALRFMCPECRSDLARVDDTMRCKNQHVFQVKDRCYDLLPKTVTSLTIEEGKYHADQRTTWADQNQIHTLRNVSFHTSFLQALVARSSKTERILELGGGVGYDLQQFLHVNPAFTTYVFSEVSAELINDTATSVSSDKIIFCTLDAQRIPFADDQFDCIFMVAAFHHLPDLDDALREIARVTKMGGVIGFGIEPNRWWLSLLKRSRWILRKMLPQKDHSAADEEAPGLDRCDLVELATKHKLKILWLEPVWLLCGFVHYGLELLYRLFRLKRRIRLPQTIEWIFVATDRMLLSLPGIRRFGWHHSVVYQKL